MDDNNQLSHLLDFYKNNPEFELSTQAMKIISLALAFEYTEKRGFFSENGAVLEKLMNQANAFYNFISEK